MPLNDKVKITKVADHSTATTGDVTSSTIDMSGFEGVLFVTSYGTPNDLNIVHVEEDDDSAFGSGADLEGTAVVTGTSASNEDVWVDVYRPRLRYVRLVAARGASTTLESIWAIQYGPRLLPVDNTTTGTITGEEHVSPAEGTA